MVQLFFGVALVLILILFFLRNIAASHLLVFSFMVLLGLLSVDQYQHLSEYRMDLFDADSIGVIFLFLLTIISSFAALHYAIYAFRRLQDKRVIAMHNAAFVLFVTAIAGAFMSTHIGMLWACLEASTLSGAALIYHDRDKLALEATWKYLFVSSIGVTLGFAGIMFLSIAANNTPNDIADLIAVAPDMNVGWTKTSFIFILAGFSVKMGVVPFFTIDIDAKDSSPSPIGAMFSGPLMSVGFLAIYRFYQIFAHTSILPWMNHLLLVTGLLSLFFATVFILKTQNYKRMLAYSSMEHAGLILIAFSTGLNGYIVAIVHLVLHALAKSGMFFEIGQVHRTFNSKNDTDCGDYFRLRPMSSAVILTGLLCIIAMPPSGLFMTEFMLFKSLMISGQWWIVFIVMFLLCFFVYAMIRNFFTLLFLKNPQAQIAEKVAGWESIPPLLLIVLVIWFGIASPDILLQLVLQAVQVLPGASTLTYY
ncbi:MAG: hypothetical protein K1X47_01985 [Cyclobacteriaceae bacterium]|nr:hypothetical protein [Cyclobacteriaceae bacterium]